MSDRKAYEFEAWERDNEAARSTILGADGDYDYPVLRMFEQMLLHHLGRDRRRTGAEIYLALVIEYLGYNSEEGFITMSDIEGRVKGTLPYSTITRIMKEWTETGEIIARPHPDDARRTCYTLSAAVVEKRKVAHEWTMAWHQEFIRTTPSKKLSDEWFDVWREKQLSALRKYWPEDYPD